MGLYVEAENKVRWCLDNGREFGNAGAALHYKRDDEFVVCAVNNGFFHAVAVGFDKDEVEAFDLPDDTRPKRWFTITKEKLKPMCPQWDSYIKEN